MLRKIKKDKDYGIVVVPEWQAQPWYPLIRKLLISESLRFSPNIDLLTSCDRKPHPPWKNLILVSRILSGRD